MTTLKIFVGAVLGVALGYLAMVALSSLADVIVRMTAR